jgi:pimeloyl-ACP methyl ester carboxylesterase
VNASLADRTIDVEGLPTRYLTAGSGPALVLVHGVGTSTSEWSWVLPALARDHLVYAIDLPGFGGPAKPPIIRLPSPRASSGRSSMPSGSSVPR